MKKKLFYLAGFVILIFGIRFGYQKFKDYQEEKAHQEWLANAPHTASPNVRILEDAITIDYLNEKRSLGIYLPENYDQDSSSYPVIYFLDGQSLFDQKIKEDMEWRVDCRLPQNSDNSKIH